MIIYNVFMLFFWVIVIVAISAITFNLVRNIKMLKKCGINNFVGKPVEVCAVVDEQTMMLIKNRKVNVDSMVQHINVVNLKYNVDSITFTKKAELVDVMRNLKAGDTVKLVYDSSNIENALFADDSETLSVKNAIKWDICFYIITLIFSVFLFMQIDASCRKVADIIGWKLSKQ